jgi:hypothetical protein
MMLRNCLVYEEAYTKRLIVGAGVLPEWLRSGQQISIGPAPTSWGPVCISFRRLAEAVNIEWEAEWFTDPPEIEVRLPDIGSVVAPPQGQTSVQIALQ